MVAHVACHQCWNKRTVAVNNTSQYILAQSFWKQVKGILSLRKQGKNQAQNHSLIIYLIMQTLATSANGLTSNITPYDSKDQA